MKKFNNKTIRIFAMVLAIVMLTMSLTGCALFESRVNDLRGDLAGVSYRAEFYDNNGNLNMVTTGERISITGNKVSERGYDSNGSSITTYSLSSVVTITIDGKQMVTCGDTVIFAETGMKKEVDFGLEDIGEINSSTDGSFGDYTSIARFVNNYKNAFGKPMVVVIQSQLGVPICAYSGEEVYWQVCEDLPKTTKLMIDGKALYIHRANFKIIDKDLID